MKITAMTKRNDWWCFALAAGLVIVGWPDYVPKGAAIVASFFGGAVFAFTVIDIRDRDRSQLRG